MIPNPSRKPQRRNETLRAKIAARLVRIRRERGLTQDNVRNDMDELNIGRIEGNVGHNITITTLVRLCDYYGITLSEFFRGIEDDKE